MLLWGNSSSKTLYTVIIECSIFKFPTNASVYIIICFIQINIDIKEHHFMIAELTYEYQVPDLVSGYCFDKIITLVVTTYVITIIFIST
jgi:hypothetical protein